MCRIYGYFNAIASPHELRTVAALQRHGGPDSSGSARDAGWGIGNNRLAIVDLDGGVQPYGRPGRYQVVFNGEIYNHNELRARLEAMGHTFADRCDGSIIPALYREYGLDFTDHLDGMYALALVDERGERPKLILATDHIGMKPLYYRWTRPSARSTSPPNSPRSWASPASPPACAPRAWTPTWRPRRPSARRRCSPGSTCCRRPPRW